MVKRPVTLFLSYAHEDEILLKEFKKHLSLLMRQGFLSTLQERRIEPDTLWTRVIDKQLEKASIILLLISADFLASDYYYGIEMQCALERHKQGQARAIPIFLRPVDWASAPFTHLQGLPRDGKAVTEWENQDQAFREIVQCLRDVIEKLPSLSASTHRTGLPPIWNIPYGQNHFFTGREEHLARLYAQLHAGQTTALSQSPQAISGLGGIGKTQIAVEYAYRNCEEYEVVLWASAESEKMLISSYTTIAGLLELPECHAEELEVTIQAVKMWLQKHGQWLLILDNADELDLLSRFLPTVPGGHILITTRASNMQYPAQNIDVETFTDQQGALFLLKRANLLEQAVVDERIRAIQLSQELGGLPLALDQAGAYLAETGMSLKQYQQHYQRYRRELLEDRRSYGSNHPDSVVATFTLSFRKVEEKNPAAADLLRLCAYLSADAIPEKMISKGCLALKKRKVQSLLYHLATDEMASWKAIVALRAYSLLRPDQETETLSVHRLVQTVLRDNMSKQEKKEWVQRAVLVVNAVCPDMQDVKQWNDCEQWLPHALICTEWIEQEKVVSREAAHILLQIGRYMHERGRYAEAGQWYSESLRIRKSIPRSAPLDVANVLCYMANLSSERGRYVEAEQWYSESLRIREAILGSDHLDVACILNNLAILRKVGGNYEEAERLHKKNLDIRERSQRTEPLTVAQALNNLGVLYAEYGNDKDAEPLFRRSLGIREQQYLASEHPDLAQSLGNFANLLTTQGNYEEAEPFYQRALSILEKIQGPEHPNVGYIHNGLGILFMKQGNYEEAEKRFSRSWAIWEQHLDSEHPQIAYAINNLALLAKVQHNYEKARRLYQQSLDIFKNCLGPEHPHIRTCVIQYADTLNTQGLLLQEQDIYEEAEEHFLQSLALLEQHLGTRHYMTHICARNYARLLRFLAREVEVEELENRYDLS